MPRTQATKVRSRGKATATATAAPQVLGAKTIERTDQTTLTTSTQLIEQQQSTEVVQSLIHGSISCLSYLRSLFPEGCFDEQWYDYGDTHWPYEDYAAGNYLPEHSSSQASAKDKGKSDPKLKGTCMRVLRRGRSKAVDTLLDWLENGAFDALKHGHLRAIQLNIFEDADHPSNVVETYTFTFNYVRSPDRSVAVVGIEMTGPKAESVTIKNAKYAMQMFIRRLIALCGTLPDLPSRRYLNMHLFYTEDCDPDYEPPGFKESDSDTVFFPDTDWKRESVSCGTMDGGFHAVTLKVSYLRNITQESSQSAGVDRGLPANLTYTEPVSRDFDIEVLKDPAPVEHAEQTENAEQTNVERVAVLKVSQEMRALTMAASASQSIQKTSHRVDRYSTTRGSNPHPQADVLARIPEDGPTQRSNLEDSLNDYEMDLDEANTRAMPGNPAPITNLSRETQDARQAHQVIDMSASSSPRAQDTQPPGDVQIKKKLERMLEPSPQDSELVETQQLSQSLSRMDRHLKMVENMPPAQLSERKIKELDGRRNSLLPPRENASSKRRRSASVDLTGEKDITSCQCGWDQDEDDMINCSFCDTWQHLHCYGYCGSDDPRIPVVHACYNCLLQDKEAPRLPEMRDLALQRRGMHIIEKQGYTNDRDFSAALRSDLQTASRLFNHLRKQGYVVPVPGPRKKGSKPKYTAATAEPIFAQMMREYFDPMTKVSHHFVELPQPKALPIDTSVTQFTNTQFTLPEPRTNTQYAQFAFPDSQVVFDSMETDDVDETQDDAATGQLTPKPSSSFHHRSDRIASLAARQTRIAAQSTSQPPVTQVDDSQGSQSSRYPLRHRTANESSPPKTNAGRVRSVMAAPKTPGNKRGRDEDQENFRGETPAERAKRLKSSMSQSLIDIGETMTPSPAPTSFHDNRF
ncbi:uncharacterized protein BDZ99DRAFT_496961 [Mytilinidion resinicola]|uniref:HORMA domain-containing protein n=1 Tax=Mytilinidion resinicola TaxID=574789 RepID=A0A6A6YUW8_9PEZI|nr:uncharacterized protein BDZ99DRAFT_496961 [Mytilinidion resinicola]KAF2812571.1 hypothetical protein BDZ99DRAFT_496961 [Mytilinidion resinicola]